METNSLRSLPALIMVVIGRVVTIIALRRRRWRRELPGNGEDHGQGKDKDDE